MVKMPSEDVTPLVFVNRIQRLSARLPLTDEFNPVSAKHKGGEKWYSTHKEHWIGWLKEYNGPGAYGAKKRRYSMEYAYNQIVNPYMLLWLAEASGVSKAKVVAARRAATKEDVLYAARSGAIRKIVPWRLICELLFLS